MLLLLKIPTEGNPDLDNAFISFLVRTGLRLFLPVWLMVAGIGPQAGLEGVGSVQPW